MGMTSARPNVCAMTSPDRPQDAPISSAIARTIRVGDRVVAVHVSAWFPFLVGSAWLIVWGSLAYLDVITRAATPPAAILASSLVAGILLLISVAVHEAGHVLAAERVGHRWVLLRLGAMGVGVGFKPVDPHGWARITRSAAGPVAQIVVCVPLVLPLFAEPLFFGGTPSLVPLQHVTWWLPGLLGGGVALLNLLPLPGLDGSKILHGIRDLARVR